MIEKIHMTFVQKTKVVIHTQVSPDVYDTYLTKFCPFQYFGILKQRKDIL